MMDQAHDRVVDVLVVGAGLAGLTAAATAARSGRHVAVLDVRSAGGRARSETRSGFVFNQGPHALYRRGPGSAVLASFGIRPTGSPPAQRVFGSRSGTLGLLPTSAGSLARSPLLGRRAKAQLATLLARFPRLEASTLAPLSAASWVGSLGVREEAASVLRTLLRVATYAPDLELISADAAVGQLQLAHSGGVVYLDGGWGRLVDSLAGAARAAGAVILDRERALGLTAGPGGALEVSTDAGGWLASAVVVAVGGPQATRAFLSAPDDWGVGADATAACLDLALRRPPHRRVAFALEEPLYLSTHSPAADLAPPGAALVHVMRYGARSSKQDRSQLWEFARLVGISEDDVVVERFLHRMIVSHALPAPGLGLAGRPAVTASGQAGVFLAGDWIGPSGLLADASLASGAAAGTAAAAPELAAAARPL
jgi:hypothetical protein